jgi:hypothetical protein
MKEIAGICKLPSLSGSALKVIALLSMTVDHIAYYFGIGGLAGELMRTLGRVAFPVFAFLLVEGFVHTRSRKRYLLSLLVFAAVSQVSWYLLTHDHTTNVFFTLAIGLMAMCVLDRFGEDELCGLLIGGAFMLLAVAVHSDYSWRGVMLILMLYFFRTQPFLAFLFSIPSMYVYGIGGLLLAFTVIVCYNERRGFVGHGAWVKYGFYVYYPLHLIIIYGCKTFLNF